MLIERRCTIDESGSDHPDFARFEELEYLIYGYLIYLDDNSVKGLTDLIEGLENSKLSELRLHVVESATGLTLSTCVSRSKRRMRPGVNIDAQIGFIRIHIFGFDFEERCDINIETDIDVIEDRLGWDSRRIRNVEGLCS
jgi:hypothetical protein